ncbi:glycosyltransferase family 2 protein [Clostridium folliculivorans]|uniref:glycosyltransferase family 2 protein n=1 Tax=Clostridium folliculivorans TaxID=2886038 RepID=UPI0021C30ECB|nr:glycosyltransferase family 2 protein [Clostridium folliculivorans]GKU31663.1 glycosyl transferase [Clostridium folliculivorans]
MKKGVIYIIILNYNGYKDTIECVKSLRQVQDLEYKIIIIDNKSTNDSLTYIHQECSDCVIIENEDNLGFAGGNNVGFKYAIENNAEYILILNNDTVVDKMFLEELINAFEDEEIGLAVPKVYFDDSTIINAFGAEKGFLEGVRNVGENVSDSEAFSKDTFVTHVMGCCMLFKTEVIKRVGMFDERFFMYLEESDLCERINKLYKIKVIGKAKIWHKCGASTNIKNQKVNYFSRYYTRRNFLLYLDKNCQGFKKWLVKTILLLKDLVYITRNFKDKKYRMIIFKAWKDYSNKNFYRSDYIQNLLLSQKSNN